MSEIIKAEIKLPQITYFLGPNGTNVFGVPYKEFGLIGLGESPLVSTLEDAIKLFELSIETYLKDAVQVAWLQQPTPYMINDKYGVKCKLAKFTLSTKTTTKIMA